MSLKRLFIALAAIALPAAAFSQAYLKPVVPTTIESVRARVQNDGDNAYILFSENVVLTATNMLVECDTLEVFATRIAEDEENIGKYGAIKEIIATGNVRIVQQERTATCERAVVQPNQERIVLSGNPVIVQPGGRIETFNPDDEIILDRGNGKISINTEGGRKLRVTSSAIGDLGFEQQSPVPTPENQAETDEQPSEEEPEEEPSQDEQPAENTTPPQEEENN